MTIHEQGYHLLKQIQVHIHGVNKYLTESATFWMSWQELLANCHPIEREDFKYKLKKLGLI